MLVKVKKGEFLEILLRRKNTVFSTKEIALLWGEKAGPAFRNRLSDYVKNKKLIRLAQGIYAKDKNYNKFELGMKLQPPAYISLETVFRSEGMTFQHYDRIFLVSYKNLEIKINGQVLEFVKIKKEILSNIAGLVQKEGVTVATPERAMLDRVYISKSYYFDNLRNLNWKKVYEILPIYESKKMEKEVRKMEKEYKERYK